MKIIIAKTAGFCMGVRRAVEMVLDSPGKHDGPICTYGPLIHNPQVLELLEEKGIHSINDIPASGTGVALIRAHGVPPETCSRLAEAGFDVIDATCPRVIKVQTIIRKHAEKNHAVIIIGDENHPEVVGLQGYAGDRCHVINNMDDLQALPSFADAIIVAQTTQNKAFLDQVMAWAATHHPHYKVFDTICDSTAKRQAEVNRLAQQVDAIIVVGGRNSGNTLRLAEIARGTGKPTFHVETEAELDLAALDAAETIGITAGASTPNWIIKRVCRRLETIPLSRKAGFRRFFFNVQRALLLTNIYVAVGAGCLSYAATSLLGESRIFPHVFIAFLYVLSMHILNNLTGMKSDRYNDPARALFYDRNKVLLTILALLAGGVGLSTAYTLGVVPFLVLLAMSITGLSYNLYIIPEGVKGLAYHRIKDIPGSKTVLIAAAWGVVTVVLPSLTEPTHSMIKTTAVWFWSTAMVFVRTAFFDLLDIQGDRIVGKETIPIVLGEARTRVLLKGLLAGCAVVLSTAALLGIVPPLGFTLSLPPLFLLLLFGSTERGAIMPGIRLEFMTETLFLLCGLITWATWVAL